MYVIIAIVQLTFMTGQLFLLLELVVDKETKMRETLRIMRMRSSVYALTHFFTHGILSLVPAITVTVVCMLNIFSFSDAVIFFSSVIFYGLSMISKTILLSRFFSDSKMA